MPVTRLVNFALMALLLITLASLVGVPVGQSITESEKVHESGPVELPASPFKVDHEAIGTGPTALKWSEPKPELPDLRSELVYYGKNGRPEIRQGKPLINLSLRSSNQSKGFGPQEKIYLHYQRGAGYQFSQEPTDLWAQLSCEKEGIPEQLSLTVFMQNKEGQIITTPTAAHTLTLNAEEWKSPPSIGWDLGGHRVDASLLARQRARLVGHDLFLERHGGQAFAHVQGRSRIDFLDNEDHFYSLFAKEGDVLVWKEGRWYLSELAEDTEHKAVMVLKKSDDRLITFDLWDPEGRGKISLVLPCSKVHEPLPKVEEDFKFIGAKTWGQFIVEHGADRMVLRADDWLILTQNGWKKIATVQEVDDYVESKLQGPLLMIEKMVPGNEGNQTLVGHLFNTARTEVTEITLHCVEKGKLR